jgi:hypothetical protein
VQNWETQEPRENMEISANAVSITTIDGRWRSNFSIYVQISVIGKCMLHDLQSVEFVSFIRLLCCTRKVC